jgi:deoxyribonuclease V
MCGLDAAYANEGAIAVAVVWDRVARRIVEIANFRDKTTVDYQPGFFGFREGRLLIGAVARLDSNPDVLLADGHGIAHPRQFGLACHVGLAVDKPTIGIAKSHFYGTVEGESIVDTNGMILGKVLTRKSGKPFYVSVGHKISLDKAVQVVESCTVDNFPFPLRIAHSEAVRLRGNF